MTVGWDRHDRPEGAARGESMRRGGAPTGESGYTGMGPSSPPSAGRPHRPTPGQLLAMQRSAGNAAVNQLFHAAAATGIPSPRGRQ